MYLLPITLTPSLSNCTTYNISYYIYFYEVFIFNTMHTLSLIQNSLDCWYLCMLLLHIFICAVLYLLVPPVPLSSVSISGSSKIGYRTALRLTCSISGTGGAYNWYRNGTFITSTTSSSYYKSPAQLSDSGYYQCRACNWAGCRFSSNSQTVRVTGLFSLSHIVLS